MAAASSARGNAIRTFHPEHEPMAPRWAHWSVSL